MEGTALAQQWDASVKAEIEDFEQVGPGQWAKKKKAATAPQRQRAGHRRFYELIKTIEDLHERKNQNYATTSDPLSNFKECAGFGIQPFMGTLVRMSDKWARIKQLANGQPDLVGESIADTLQDLAVYSIIAMVLYEEQLLAKSQNEGNR